MLKLQQDDYEERLQNATLIPTLLNESGFNLTKEIPRRLDLEENLKKQVLCKEQVSKWKQNFQSEYNEIFKINNEVEHKLECSWKKIESDHRCSADQQTKLKSSNKNKFILATVFTA